MSLKLGYITSFLQSGIANFTDAHWPSQTPNVELYCFMAEDLAFATENGMHSSLTACHGLAGISDHDACAARLNALFGSRGCRIRAISSFLPEISRADSTEADVAVEALKSLVKLARALRAKKNGGHDVRVIELVGGSSVGGIWRGYIQERDGGGQVMPGLSRQEIFVLPRRNPQDAIRTLVKRLEPVAEVAAKDDPVYLAVELEPGPLFTIGEDISLHYFCQWIETDGATTAANRQVLGVNLDIAHWAFLTNLKPEWVETQPSVYRRITHAHISGHSKGHFGDICPDELMIEKFTPWLELLRKIVEDSARRGKETPRFSGLVSCEMECCRATDVVREAIQKIKDRHFP